MPKVDKDTKKEDKEIEIQHDERLKLFAVTKVDRARKFSLHLG